MLELRKEIAGIVNISGHNVVTSEIASFVNVGSDKFRIFYKNGVEKEYNVREANIAALEDAIIKAISYSKLPYGGEVRTMPHFDSFQRPHNMYNPHFNRPVSRPSASRGGPYINHAANREYGSTYDNGFNNFTNARDNVNAFGAVPNSDWLRNPIADIILRDSILHLIFVSDEAHGIRVPTFIEIETSLDFKKDWQLASEYTDNDYADILVVINNKMAEFKILLNKVSSLAVKEL